MYSVTNFTICSSNSDINGNLTRAGVITNDGYPNYLINQNCERKIIVPSNKLIRIFISELNLDDTEVNGMYAL